MKMMLIIFINNQMENIWQIFVGLKWSLIDNQYSFHKYFWYISIIVCVFSSLQNKMLRFGIL